MKLLLCLLLILAIVCVVGCASGPAATVPEADVTGGTRLILNTNLRIVRGNAHTDVQYGKPTDGPNLADPFCKFTVYELARNEALTLPKGVYQIESASQDTRPGDTVMGKDSARVHLAALTLAQGMLVQADFVTVMKIKSNPPPNLIQVSCHNVEDVDTGRHLTRDQINQVLGPVAEIMP